MSDVSRGKLCCGRQDAVRLGCRCWVGWGSSHTGMCDGVIITAFGHGVRRGHVWWLLHGTVISVVLVVPSSLHSFISWVHLHVQACVNCCGAFSAVSCPDPFAILVVLPLMLWFSQRCTPLPIHQSRYQIGVIPVARSWCSA
jgi:hypothetical protein